jgi:hypothetical protein
MKKKLKHNFLITVRITSPPKILIPVAANHNIEISKRSCDSAGILFTNDASQSDALLSIAIVVAHAHRKLLQMYK